MKTYTIRRLGCTAWLDGIEASAVADALREANDVASGHRVIDDQTGRMLSTSEVELLDQESGAREWQN